MKQFVLIIALVIGATFSTQAQTSEHTSIMFKTHYMAEPGLQASLLTTRAEPQLASMLDLNLREKGDRGNRRYENAKHKQKTGIVLTAIGGTFLIGGATLLAVGGKGIKNDIEYGDSGNGVLGSSFLSHYLELAFGSIFAIAGTGMTIPGAIITAKGTRDLKKFKASQTVN